MSVTARAKAKLGHKVLFTALRKFLKIANFCEDALLPFQLCCCFLHFVEFIVCYLLFTIRYWG